MTSQKRTADYELNANSVEILEVRLFASCPSRAPHLTLYVACTCLYDYDDDRQRNLAGLDGV